MLAVQHFAGNTYYVSPEPRLTLQQSFQRHAFWGENPEFRLNEVIQVFLKAQAIDFLKKTPH